MKVLRPCALVALALCSCASTETPRARVAPEHLMTEAVQPRLAAAPRLAPQPAAEPAPDDKQVTSFSGNLSLSSLSFAAAVAGQSNHIYLHIGRRDFDSDLDPVDEQPAFGVSYLYEPPDWPLGLEVAMIVSGDDDEVFVGPTEVDVDAQASELAFGVRKTFGQSLVRPYLGAGLSLLFVEAELEAFGSSIDDDDTAVGLYAHAGVSFQVTDELSFGIDGRWVTAEDVDIKGVDVDADSFLLTLFLGVSF